MIIQTAVDIANRALRHLAVTRAIVSLADESEEAKACLAFYETTLEEVLRDYPWPFAWKYAALTLVDGTEAIATSQDFQYSYRLPSDAVRVHRILGDNRLASDINRIAFSLGSDDVGGLLYTDIAPVAATDTVLAQPQLEYTASVAESALASDVASVIAWKLAFYMAPSVAKGDAFKLGDRAYLHYERSLLEAKASAAREEQQDEAAESSFITARE